MRSLREEQDKRERFAEADFREADGLCKREETADSGKKESAKSGFKKGEFRKKEFQRPLKQGMIRLLFMVRILKMNL